MTNPIRRTLVHGGTILTQNEDRDIHEALVIEGDAVLATGALSEMRALAGASARQVDLQGATVLPGLIDNHPHQMHYGSFDAGCIKLYDARDHADILGRIRQRAAMTPPGQWILTTPVGEPHYFIRRSWRDLPEGRLPNRQELDSAAPDHPVMIQAYAPRTPNTCAMNSKALQTLGFTRDLPDVVDNVTIEKDAHGELTGRFHGSVTNYYNGSVFWLTRVSAQALRGDEDFWYRGGLAGQLTAARSGVTAIYEGHAMEPEMIAGYQRMRAEKRLALRVLATLEGAPCALDSGLGLTDEKVRGNFALAAKLKQTTDERFRVDGLTMSSGGAAWPGFMRWDTPYLDPYGNPTHGRAFIAQHLDKEAIEYCLRHDVRLNRLHCSAPDHREFLEWITPHLKDFDVRAREWVVQHNIFIDDESVRRLADLNIHFTATASFCWGKGDMYAERLGEAALKDLSPIGKLFASGANVGLGSDWGPASPFEHMALAQTREMAASGRRLDGPGYSITRQQAIDGWTRNNARLMRWSRIGSLQRGFKADLTIVDRNPLTCAIEDLPKTQVLRTVLDGADIFDTKILPRLDDADLPQERVQDISLAVALRRGGAAHQCTPSCTHPAD